MLVLFGCIVAILALSYYFFLRTQYVPLYSELRPADASAIVAELDRRGIVYRLGDGGTTILVADGESDAVRLAIAGSELPLNGLVGFELFNESDLGLTDFSQKINYQRALQGELARTIMMMDGVENARVHLAIPERNLFRGNRSETRAAVTVVPRRGRSLDEARVSGIQRLVAASVPDLALANVVVLDEVGRVISSEADIDAIPPAMEERTAVQNYYRARIRSAVEPVFPGHRFDVRVLAITPDDRSAVRAEAGISPAPLGPAAAPDAGPQRRQFRLRVTFLTSEALAPDEQSLVANAARSAADLDDAAGDSLVFGIAPIDFSATPPVSRAASASRNYDADPVPPSTPQRSSAWANGWGTVAALLLLAAMLLLLRARRTGAESTVRDAFVQRLRAQLRGPREEGQSA